MEKDSNWHILGVRIWTINVNVCKPLFVWFRNFNPFSFCLLVSLRLVDLVRVTQRRSHQPTSPYPSFFPNFTTLFVCLMANCVNPRRSFTALGLLLSSPPASSPLHHTPVLTPHTTQQCQQHTHHRLQPHYTPVSTVNTKPHSGVNSTDCNHAQHSSVSTGCNHSNANTAWTVTTPVSPRRPVKVYAMQCYTAAHCTLLHFNAIPTLHWKERNALQSLQTPHFAGQVLTLTCVAFCIAILKIE